MPVDPLDLWWSIGHLVESIVVSGWLPPLVVQAKSGLEGGWSNADDAEELSVVTSMVVALGA